MWYVELMVGKVQAIGGGEEKGEEKFDGWPDCHALPPRCREVRPSRMLKESAGSMRVKASVKVGMEEVESSLNLNLDLSPNRSDRAGRTV